MNKTKFCVVLLATILVTVILLDTLQAAEPTLGLRTKGSLKDFFTFEFDFTDRIEAFLAEKDYQLGVQYRKASSNEEWKFCKIYKIGDFVIVKGERAIKGEFRISDCIKESGDYQLRLVGGYNVREEKLDFESNVISLTIEPKLEFDCPDGNRDGLIDQKDVDDLRYSLGESYCAAAWVTDCDFDNNGIVDEEDRQWVEDNLGKLASEFSNCPIGACPDINVDGIRDKLDYNIFDDTYDSGADNCFPYDCDLNDDDKISWQDNPAYYDYDLSEYPGCKDREIISCPESCTSSNGWFCANDYTAERRLYGCFASDKSCTYNVLTTKSCPVCEEEITYDNKPDVKCFASIDSPSSTKQLNPMIRVIPSENSICRISDRDLNFDEMTLDCPNYDNFNLVTQDNLYPNTTTFSDYILCFGLNNGMVEEKKYYISCRSQSGFETTKENNIETSVTILPDDNLPVIDAYTIPTFGYTNSPIIAKALIYDEDVNLDKDSIEMYIEQNGARYYSQDLDCDSLDLAASIGHNRVSFLVSCTGSFILNRVGEYKLVTIAGDKAGNSNKAEYTGNIIKLANRYRIYVVAVNYDDMNAYRKRAQDRMNTFLEESPFRECRNGIDIRILDQNCQCPDLSDYDSTWDICEQEVLQCVENMGLNDHDLVFALSDDPIVNGFADMVLPFAMCFGGLPEGLDRTCPAHEIGHKFKLCDEYDRFTWEGQNVRFKNFGILKESQPFSSCGNPYPLDNGIGPDDKCDTDCSVDNTACDLGTCGKKIGGNSPPYDTDIMGGGGNMYRDSQGNYIMVGNPVKFGSEGYNSILVRIREAGYCD